MIFYKYSQYIQLSLVAYASIAQSARMPIKIAIFPLSPEIGHVLPTRPSPTVATDFILATRLRQVQEVNSN